MYSVTSTLHKPTFDVTLYPSSGYAYKITTTCSCGNKSTLTDGAAAPTIVRAKAAHARHTAKAVGV